MSIENSDRFHDALAVYAVEEEERLLSLQGVWLMDTMRIITDIELRGECYGIKSEETGN